MNIVLIPDSFKGTMSSREVCEIMHRAIARILPKEAEVREIPVADGGEGTVEAFLHALGGTRVELEVTGPYFDKVPAFYGILPDGKTAVVEMAACAGLPLVGEDKRPGETTTFGVGEIFLHAARHSCTKIIAALGGSCTNDAGTGAAAACGVRFFNLLDEVFIPTGATLDEISRIDASSLFPSIRDVEFITMCDIDNPLYGPTGAAYVFAPQKGADAAQVACLDRGLRHFAEISARDLGMDIATVPGTGAAGGMGAGMALFFDSRLQSGIETLLDTVQFDDLLPTCDLVFTGEGRLDAQSLRGKVVLGVARRAKGQGVPVFAVVGDIGDEIDSVYERGVTAVFSINRVAQDFDHVRHRAAADLEATMENILRVVKIPSLEK